MEEKVLLSWSGGKDSTLTLRELRASGYTIVALLTTLTEGYDRVSMHGVRRDLLRAQADSLGLKLEEVWIPKDSSNETYERRMRDLLEVQQRAGVGAVAFGDLFLADIRAYREERLAQIGMKGIFPLWQRDTGDLAREFIALGFKAVICCVDPRRLSREFCGAEYDEEFLSRLPPEVDPCGENGEFHSFVYAGPDFTKPLRFEVGEVVERQGFYFADLVPR